MKKIVANWLTTLFGLGLAVLGLYRLHLGEIVWYEGIMLVVSGMLLVWATDPKEVLEWGDKIKSWFK